MKAKVFALVLISLFLFSCGDSSDPFSPGTPTEPAKNLPTIRYFTATPAVISPGESSTLSWQVLNAVIVKIDHLIGQVSSYGTKDVSPPVTTIYELTAMNGDGEVMMVYDIHDTKLSIGKCENCKKEYEIRETEEGLEPVIKELKVS